MPVGAPVPAPPWLGVDLGHVEKPRIRLEQVLFSLPARVRVCRGASCEGVGSSPRHAYDAWRKDVRQHAALRCLPAQPIVHPTAERLLADLEAAIASRPAGWWRKMLPPGAKWRDVFMQSGQP